ncbi:hypothetical protein ABZX40_14830 [Streptomyces sp. NPDC004610]|uniref:hypothetical protein n=1 Tax=unclassified Streptomyces TaxID=2593676 RepID=UPI0033B29EBD
MKALVLAGGAATRLRTIIHTPAGHRVPAAHRTVPLHGPQSPAGAGITGAGAVERRIEGDTDAVPGAGTGGGADAAPGTIGRVVADDHSTVRILP